ncbi:MAG: virulence protein RhuM/Fic/DOC family protein [Candidatus Moraniibacteriota bacterium]
MAKHAAKKGLVLYQAKSGAIELKGDVKKETLWASLDQIAQVFERDKSVISRHIKNIFKESELKRPAVVAFFATTAADGKTYQVEYFNLDVILSVGYRVNSKRATQFRQWATKTLRAHILDGYTINRTRIGKNYDAFMQAVADVRALLPAGMKTDTGSILELVRLFADTWVSLDAYDREVFDVAKPTKKKVVLTGARLAEAVSILKAELLKKHEATELFAQERGKQGLEGIVGNVMQAIGGRDVYPSVEAKAAHLLYFIVKNHPFVDGNKRTGAYAFVWFLNMTRLLDATRLTPEALTAITLLIAESHPRDKEKMVKLVMLLIGRK